MIIYVNGCSNSDDLPLKINEKNEKINKSFLWHHYLMENYSENFKYYKISNNFFVKRTNYFDEKKYIIKDVDGDLLINDAISSCGNDKIFHSSLESITTLIDSEKKPDVVIIQWTGPSRRVYSEGENHSIFVTPHDNTHLHLKLEPMGSLHSLHYIFCLQEFLIKNNITYLFFNYIGLDPVVKNTQIIKKINMNRILDFGNETFFNGLIDLFKKKEFVRDTQGHPNQEGSKYIAEKIKEKLCT